MSDEVSDPVADLLLESAAEAEEERTARRGIEARLASVEVELRAIRELLVQNGRKTNGSGNKTYDVQVTGRDSYDRIDSVKVTPE